MIRKIIQQGKAYTVTLPIKWIRDYNIKASDEITLSEEENKLILLPGEAKKIVKKIQIEVELKNFNTYRSLISGLYRGGYDEINVKFKDPKVIPLLQKVVDSLYGFEIFNVDKSSCTIKSLYQEEATEISPHINRMIHTINTMHSVIKEDLKEKKFESKEQLFQYRNNVLKQRDIIARTITQNKLLDNKHFPHYRIAFSLWEVARNYYLMYDNIDKKQTKKNIDFLEETSQFFSESFKNLSKQNLKDRYSNYDKIRSKGFKLMKDKNQASVIISFCLNILMAIQSADSSLVMLNAKLPDE